MTTKTGIFSAENLAAAATPLVGDVQNLSTGYATVVSPAPKPDPIDNTELVDTFKAEGGKLYHFRPFHSGRQGVTFAYKVKGNRIEFSTAVQHRNDTFTKKLGTKTAIDHFNSGKTVFLPLGKVFSPVQILHMIGQQSAR